MEQKSSQWRIAQIALFIFIGNVIGSLLVKPSLIYIFGALSVFLMLVFTNIIYVFYKKKKE